MREFEHMFRQKNSSFLGSGEQPRIVNAGGVIRANVTVENACLLFLQVSSYSSGLFRLEFPNSHRNRGNLDFLDRFLILRNAGSTSSGNLAKIHHSQALISSLNCRLVGLSESRFQVPPVIRAAPTWETIPNAMLAGKPMRGIWFNRTAERFKRRSGEQPDPMEFAEAATVRLTPLPCWGHLSPGDQRKRLRSLIRGGGPTWCVGGARSRHHLFGRAARVPQRMLW
jgi:hypothetical protein